MINVSHKNISDNPVFLSAVLIFMYFCGIVSPSESSSNPSADVVSGPSSYKSLLDGIHGEWDGHIKTRGAVSWPGDLSYFEPVGTGAYYDGVLEGRLNTKVFFSKWAHLETQYEIVMSGGDTRRKQYDLAELYPSLFTEGLLFGQPIDDSRRVMNLTRTISENDDYVIYHHLDRLNLTIQPDWGTIRLGRQVITWGNGMLFNPMDLVNPFSPTDIERDYKVGDDMVFTEFSDNDMGSFQLIYVPRRDPASEDIGWDQSSVAGKYHFEKGDLGGDIMAATHYRVGVFGLGFTGYLGGAAWRLNGTYTLLDDDQYNDDYLALVVNMDYSWVWWGKNFYGFIEYYHNGLGDNDYVKASEDPDIVARIERGELFALGRDYLGVTVNMEAHPLLNIYITVIDNLSDPSGSIQPRAVYSLSQNSEVIVGGTIYYGGKNSEFGGYAVTGTDLYNKAGNELFLWISYYF